MAVEKTINLNVNTKGAQKNVKDLEKSVEGVNNEVLGVGDPWDGEPLVLGCDVLAGHFVVDPGRS